MQPENNNLNNNSNQNNSWGTSSNNVPFVSNDNINSNPTQNLTNKNSTLGDLSGRYAVPESNAKGKLIYGLIATVIIILFAALYYYFAPSSPAVVNNTNNVLSFPDLSKGEGSNFYNATSSNTANGEDGVETDYSELVHVWNKPVLAFVYKKDKKIEVVQSEVSDNASNTQLEATLSQKTIEREVENVYFVDKSTGNIYRSDLETYRPERISKTSIVGVSSATFDHTGTFLALIKDGDLILDRVSNTEDGMYNVDNIVDRKVVSVYNNNFDSNLLYTKNENGGLGLYKIETAKSKTQRLGYIPLTNVNISWENANYIYVSSAANPNYNQVTMTYNFATGKLNTYATNDGDSIMRGASTIYSKAGNLRYKNTTGTDNDLELKTFASKCLFVADMKVICSVPNILYGGTLDDWFMGRVSFIDSMYYMDLAKGDRQNFFDQSIVSGENIDSYNLRMDNTHLTFQNKNDDSLWVLETQYLIK